MKSFFASGILALLLVFLPLQSAVASPEFRQAEVSKNISQFIRSNAVHYWSYMKGRANSSALKPYLKFQGFVAGDPHMGNFAPIPLRSQNGSRQMRFVNIDFDDAGFGPFAIDFARYVVTVEASHPKVKKGDLEEAYVLGLSGESVRPEKEIQEFLDMPVAEYDALAVGYVQKHTNSKGFLLEQDKLEADRGDIPRSAIAAQFPGMKLVDVAIRPRERGGSEGIRLWCLVEEKDGFRHIMELKPWETSGLTYYQQQPALEQWLMGVYETFWPKFDTSEYSLIEIKGHGLFWKRQKKFSMIDELKDEFKTANSLAIYDANLLGLAHGRQKQSAAYLAEINRDPKAFHKAIEAAVDDYLTVAKNAYEKLKKK